MESEKQTNEQTDRFTDTENTGGCHGERCRKMGKLGDGDLKKRNYVNNLIESPPFKT